MPKHHAMKKYRGSGGKALYTLNLSTVVSFMFEPLYTQGKSSYIHWIGGWVDPRAGLNVVAKK
jgi:hypothetical protein